VADVGPRTITFEISSDEFRIESFLKMLESHHILEVVRSGKIALFKGDRPCFNGRSKGGPKGGEAATPRTMISHG
jgi:acetolactate synthase-1/3 small subunit